MLIKQNLIGILIGYYHISNILKLQSVNSASLLPSLFENLECAELSSLRGLCSGTAPARINLTF